MIKILNYNFELDENNKSNIIINLDNSVRYILAFKFFINGCVVNLDKRNTKLHIFEMCDDKKYNLFSEPRELLYFEFKTQFELNLEHNENLGVYDYLPNKYTNHKLNLEFTFAENIKNMQIKLVIFELQEYNYNPEYINAEIKKI